MSRWIVEQQDLTLVKRRLSGGKPRATVVSTSRRKSPGILYRTKNGVMIRGDAEKILGSSLAKRYEGKVQLIFTSPPFPLNRKKKYGNLQGEGYSDWLAEFAPIFKRYLRPDGSVVIEMGNAWIGGKPIMSTLAYEALLEFRDKGGFNLCQQFIAYNKARLPSPAQWVNVERIRVKDSYTNLWWMSPTDRPKADNKRILKEYTASMRRLLETKKYSSGRRPSEHNIGRTSFLKDNKGAIPSNVLIVSNTIANDDYMTYCRSRGVTPHPARMPKEVAEFFVKFLTEPGDVVMDPFAGSNTTGWVSERLGRKWISIEKDRSYAIASKSRFTNNSSHTSSNRMKTNRRNGTR